MKTENLMKTEFRLSQHTQRIGETVIEVWHDGKFLATIIGSDGPGVRIVSKHLLHWRPLEAHVLEILINDTAPQAPPASALCASDKAGLLSSVLGTACGSKVYRNSGCKGLGNAQGG